MPKAIFVCKTDYFLEIFEHIISRAKITKNRPEFLQFFENHPRDLKKLPKINFSQQILKDKNLRIPKHTDF